MGTKVFNVASVVKKVNGAKVSSLEDLCHALKKPVQKQWMTVEMADGTFGAMIMKDAEANDAKLAKTGLFKLADTKCVVAKKTAKKEGKKTKKAKKVKKAKKAKAKALIQEYEDEEE